MRPTIATTVLVAVLLSGCTSLNTTQIDESPERKITTKTSGTAWFSSAQSIEKLKATTTDKTQSVGFDAAAQHGATNMVDALGHVRGILEALKP